MPKNKKNLPKKQAKRGNLPLPVDVIDELRDWKRAYELAWSDPAPDGKQYTMTNEQLIRRLLEGVKRLDPEVWAVHEAARKSRQEQDEMMADFKKRYWPDLMWTRKKVNKFYDDMIGEITDDRDGKDSPASVLENVGTIEDESFFPEEEVEEEVKEEEVMPVPEAATVDPTEGAVWDMRYYFVKDGEELDALVGDKAAFYCKLNGRNTGMATMINSGWKLVNEAGVELTKSQAAKIREIIKSHNTEK